jgi:hypothetical protein
MEKRDSADYRIIDLFWFNSEARAIYNLSKAENVYDNQMICLQKLKTLQVLFHRGSFLQLIFHF